MNLFKTITSYFILSILCGCAWLFSSPSYTKSSHSKNKLPNVPTNKIPEGSGDNWRYIGTTDNGTMVVEINNNSIKTLGNGQVFAFEDRKMIVDQTLYSYAPEQPQFKYLISNWQIDCQNKQYLLLNAKMFSSTANLLKSLDYTNNSDVKWLKFGDGSIADLEYKFVCLNQNRNLGY